MKFWKDKAGPKQAQYRMRCPNSIDGTRLVRYLCLEKCCTILLPKLYLWFRDSNREVSKLVGSSGFKVRGIFPRWKQSCLKLRQITLPKRLLLKTSRPCVLVSFRYKNRSIHSLVCKPLKLFAKEPRFIPP